MIITNFTTLLSPLVKFYYLSCTQMEKLLRANSVLSKDAHCVIRLAWELNLQPSGC